MRQCLQDEILRYVLFKVGLKRLSPVALLSTAGTIHTMASDRRASTTIYALDLSDVLAPHQALRADLRARQGRHVESKIRERYATALRIASGASASASAIMHAPELRARRSLP